MPGCGGSWKRLRLRTTNMSDELVAAQVRCLRAEQERDEIRSTIREASSLKDEALGLGVYRRAWARALDKLEEEQRLREQAESRARTLKKVLEAAYTRLLEKDLFPASPKDIEIAEQIASVIEEKPDAQ